MSSHMHDSDVQTVDRFPPGTEGLPEAGRPQIVELSNRDAFHQPG
jgi:hypothetical protein